MGGKAFAAARAPHGHRLNIQPLDQAHYDQLKVLCLDRIRAYLGVGILVDVLKEAPEKTSYGDIDYLVAMDKNVDFVDLAKAVGAAAVVKHGPSICSIAVRQDGSGHDSDVAVYTKLDGRRPSPVQPTSHNEEIQAASTLPLCAQIDIEVVPQAAFAWRSFQASYGGIGMILGRIVRDVGFSFHGDGLWLQLPELDEAKQLTLQNIADKSGMIWLSNDAAEVMKFMHMSTDHYQQGFDSLQDLYAWLASCRMLLDEALGVARADDAEHTEVKYQGKPKLYRNFFQEGIHTVPRGGEMYNGMMAEEVRRVLFHEALEKFDKTAEYQEKSSNLQRRIAHGKAEGWLKDAITKATGKEGKNATEIVRSFRRWLGVKDLTRELYILPSAVSDEDSELHKLVADDRARLQMFVTEHWEEVRGLLRHA